MHQHQQSSYRIAIKYFPILSNRFPLHDESLLRKWIAFTDRGADWKPSRWSSICSRHFLNSDFRELLLRKCLKKNAVPSVVTKNNVSYETYHIADQTLTATSQYEDEDPNECNDDKETETPTNIQLQNQNEPIQIVCCRLCGNRIDESVKTPFNFRIDDQEIGEILRKCMPSINILRHSSDNLNLVCLDCVSHLRRHSEFLNKILTFQRDFDRSNNADTSLEHMIFESRTCNSGTTNNSALFIKQEPINVKQEILDSSNKRPQEAINVMKSSILPSTSMKFQPNFSSNDQRINVVEQSLIQWPRISANTFCRLCERIFINNAEMRAHVCTGSQTPNIERIEPMNGMGNNNNCEIMEIITLNNPVSFIDLAEDECAIAEQAAICKKENVIDGERRERVDIEHAYAKRTTITIHTASNTPCKLKQEIELNYDCEPNEDIISDTEIINDHNTIGSSIPIMTADVTAATLDNFICSKCDQEFDTNRLLVDHSNKMHSLKNRICTICSAEFKSMYEYLLHKNKVHVSGYRCKQCKRKFNTRLALKNHERHSCAIDSTDFFYSCRHCGKFMRNRIKMKEHLRICEQNSNRADKTLISMENIYDTKAYNCSRCHRSFRKEINYVSAQKYTFHFPCQLIFGFLFPQKRHTTILCKMKNSKSRSNKSADSMQNTETSKVDSTCGKYVCEKCSKPFPAYANLKQHRTTHENEKKFVCVLCPKKFKRISGLNQHVRGFHYKIKPFSCPICSYTYALKGDMLRCRHSSLKKDATTANPH